MKMFAKTEHGFEAEVLGFSLHTYIDVYWVNQNHTIDLETYGLGETYVNNNESTISFSVENSIPFSMRDEFYKLAKKYVEALECPVNADWRECEDDVQADELA